MFDFGLGATELMLIAIVALIVVGPKDLPRLMRWVGNAVAKVRALAREFQGHLDEAMKETGLDEVKESVSQVKEYTVADLDAEFEKLEREFRETALPDSPLGDAEDAQNRNASEADNDGVETDEDLLDETERSVLSLDEDPPSGTKAGKDKANATADMKKTGERTSCQAGKPVARAEDPMAGAPGEEAASDRAEGTDTSGKTT